VHRVNVSRLICIFCSRGLPLLTILCALFLSSGCAMTNRVWHEDNYSLKFVTNHTITGYAYALTNNYLRIVTSDSNSWQVGIPSEYNMSGDYSRYSEKERLELQKSVVSSVIGEIRRSRASYPLDLYDLRLLKVGKLYKKTEWEDRWDWEGNENNFVPNNRDSMFFHSSHGAYAWLDNVKHTAYDGEGVTPCDAVKFGEYLVEPRDWSLWTIPGKIGLTPFSVLYDVTVVPYDCLCFAFWAMTNPNAFR